MLTEAQTARALYIDFEGGQDVPPSFIGTRTHDNGSDLFEQVIVEQSLYRTLDLPNPTFHRWAEDYARIEDLTSRNVRPKRTADTFSGMVKALVRRAETEERLILSWSSRERDVILASPFVEDDIKQRFETRWHDAKLLAKVWKRATHPNVIFERLPGRGRNRLDCYMRLIGYDLPSYFGDRQAAQRIDYVRQQLQAKGSADALTATAKAKWTKVLDYNWHDCNGMREVTVRAAKELNG